MINSNPFPPVPSPTPPVHSIPVIWVPVNSSHLTPLIIPVFFNMPLSKEGMAEVDNVRPIPAGEGAVGKEIKGEPGSEEPVPEVEPADPKDVSKDKIDLLARFIAKEVIPEKLASMTFVRLPVHHSTTPTQPSKEDKGAVEQAQKDPKNSNLAVPKESVKPTADQLSYNKFHFAAKIATTNKEMKENGSMESLPEENPRLANSTQKMFADTIKLDASSINKTPIESNPASAKKFENFKVEDSKKSLEQTKIVETEKRYLRTEGIQSKEPKEPPNHEKTGPKNLDNPFKAKSVEAPAYDPLKKTPNEHIKRDNKASDPVNEIEAGKHAKPRKDAIPILDKNESPSVQQMHRFVDESLVARMPIMPDFPLSREAILRQAGTPKNTRLREDQGYRLGDLMVMVLSGVLGGAKNTVEICRYLLAKEKFFKVWMGIKNTMPTFRMLWFLLNRLEPKFLEALLQESVGMRASKLVHTHVWESHRGFTFGELIPLVPSQSSEILLGILDLIDSYGAMVNLEAPALNRTAARKIKLNGGEYILTLKGETYKQAEEYLKNPNEPIDQYRDVIQEGSVTTIREILATDQLLWFQGKEEWPYLQSLVKFKSQSIQDHRLNVETKLYVSSLPMQADRMAQVLRIFSVMEGKVNWLADFDFLVQDSKGFRENENANIEILRQFSEEILTGDTSNANSNEAKRKKIRESNEYLRYLINNLNLNYSVP